MQQPLLAVIIPTRGRDDCLRVVLRDLSAQDFERFEVWIVDQNDSPLANLESEISANISFYHECLPPVGSHAGRNHAIFRTKAQLCVFVDDDVRLEPDFLRKHVQTLVNSEANVVAISGRVIQPRDGYSGEKMKKIGAPARYNRWLGRVSGNFVGMTPAFVDHVHECNFSAKTKALREIGGFNEEFRGNAYFEGADLALRLIEKNQKILYSPEIVLTHLQEPAGGNRVSDKAQHTYWYMRNYALLNALHMKTVGIPIFVGLGLAYVLAKGVKNVNPAIVSKGLRGLYDGLKYFKPSAKRAQLRSE